MKQPKVYVKRLDMILPVEVINYHEKTVEVYLNDNADYVQFDFDEVRFLKNTGYKDKNGNCICEYDIVKYHDDGEDEDLKGSIFIVVKEQCGTSYYLEYHGFNMANLINSYQDITVIGNICESEELVE